MKLLSSVLSRSGLRCAAAAALALTLSGAPALATTIERVVSPGGIEAWFVHETAVPLVTINFVFTGGSSQDPTDKSGTANLMASLLDEGAGSLDAKAYQERLDSKAVEVSFHASRDHIQGSLRTLAENRDEAFDDLRLALNEPRFDAAAVELNRAQTLSNLRRELTSPTDLAALRWWSTAFAGHPYGQPVGGTLASVPKITIDDLKSYAHRVMARDNLKVAVVGDIDADQVKTMLDRVFGALPAKAELVPAAPALPQGLGRRITVDLDVPQTVINFGGVGISRNDPDFWAAYIDNDILGGGNFSSRLYQQVREKRGLVYSVYDSLIWLDNSAVFYGSTATRADRTAETVDLIEKEIHRLAEDGPTADELAKDKSYINSAFVLNLDSSTKVAALLVQLQLDHQPIDYITRRPQRIAAVTVDDAKRVAKRLFEGGLLVTEVGRPAALASSAGGAGGGHARMPGAAQPGMALPGASGELR